MANITKQNIDVLLDSNCHHQPANSFTRAQHSDVQSRVGYHSAIKVPLADYVYVSLVLMALNGRISLL